MATKQGGSASDGDQPQQTHSFFAPSYEDLVRELSSLQQQRRQPLTRSRARLEGIEVPDTSNMETRTKTRPQRARAPEDPYQSPSSGDDQVRDDAASPYALKPDNNDDGSTHHNSDASSKDSPVQPQAKANQKTLDPIKEDKIQQLESKLQEMEVATKSLPAMSSALENIQDSLALMQTTANLPTPNLDTQPRKDVSDTSDEECAHQMRRRQKTTKSEKKTMNQIHSYYSRTRSHSVDKTTTLPTRAGYESDTSSEEYLDKSYATGHDEDVPLTNIVPFHSRPKGPPHVGLRSIKPANRIFDKLMSYRSYRLMVTTETRSSRATAEVRTHIKNLSLTMNQHTFDGSDPIKIFDFLTRFVNEADILAMSEAQAFIALPTFLADPAETQFRTNLSGGSRRGGINCCLKPSSIS